MKVSYHGHSIVQIETNGKNIIIDPFINGNGQTDLKVEDVKADVILLTHGHNDHVGDTVEIAKRNDSLVVAIAELATYLSWKGIKTHGMSIGGAYEFEFGKVKLTQAFHGSSYTEDNQNIVYTGMPAGILLTAEDKTIYHAGDTALFSDMKLIGERNEIDLAFLPIGDNYTMGPEDALTAAEWIRAKKVVPIHYNTFPVIQQNPEDFVSKLPDGVGLLLKPGETIEL
ncbi:metal-dependent hydrolase [Aeribacillus pallidus]|uniref:metal-dependent hydrolase n=1 Tax=Aeribacillus TaxID=1055323 RepID=UPI0007B4A596|nr:MULTISPECIES: metal-dependent hydrolase [Aeribacillus]KZM56533.1 metal-dependent hydrolase [Aeribacillus pallidus]MED0651163.1 metal-dependent hydrolase [Aeribacillus composti]MED4486518.1 metal-dependent hydrolase [Aeribacillus pallidus]